MHNSNGFCYCTRLFECAITCKEKRGNEIAIVIRAPVFQKRAQIYFSIRLIAKHLPFTSNTHAENAHGYYL
jgi:hypothetical protein